MTDTLPEMEICLPSARVFPVPWIDGLMPMKGGPRIRAEIFQKRGVVLLELRRFQLVRQLRGPACAAERSGCLEPLRKPEVRSCQAICISQSRSLTYSDYSLIDRCKNITSVLSPPN